MPLIKCLHDSKVDAKTIEALAAKSKELQKNGISETEADRKVKNEYVVDEHNKLATELHEVKKEAKLVRANSKPPKPIKYSEPDLTEINKKYEGQKNSIKPQAETPPPIVEETKPEEIIIEEPTGGEPPKEPPLTETGSGKTVGVSHANLTDLAQKLGLKESERGEFYPPEWYAERGRRLLKEGADPNEVDNPNNELHDRIAVARAQLENLVKSADEVGKEKGFDSDEYREELKKVDDYANNVVKKLGTLAHRAFESLQGNRDLDTDSFTSVKQSFTDATGTQPSKAQEEKIKELTATNQKLKIQADELEKKLIEATNESIGKKPKEKATAKKSHEQYVQERNDSFQAARDALKKLRTGQSGLGASIPLARELSAVAPHMAKIVKSLLEEGVDKLGDLVDYIHDELSKDMVGLRRRDVIDLVSGEYVKQADKSTELNKYADIKKQAKLVQKLEDLQNGLPENFDSNKVEQSAEVKKLLEQIKKVKEDLAAIGYMQKKVSEPLSAEEKNINRLQKELDKIKQGEAKQSSPKRELTEREKELQEQIRDEREKLGLVSSKGEKPLTEEEQRAADEKELVALQEQLVDKNDSKFTIDEAKSIWNYAKKNYLDKGVSYKDMIQQVSQDLGLSWRQVSDAITTPKVRPISDAMWKKQSDYRRNQLATKDWVEQQDKNPFSKALKKVSGAFRGVAVFGHGGIFMGTHAGMTLFQPSTWNKTIPAFFRGWKYAYFQKVGAYEREMEAFKHRDNYVLAQRAGLKNNPERLNGEEFQKSQKYLGRLGLAGERGFNAVKVLRQDLFDYHYNKLSEAEKADPNAVKNVAKLVNLATGATNLNIPEWVNEVSFAGGMEAARWGKLTRNPAKATVIALKSIYNPSKVAIGERVFAKVWARRVGEQLAALTSLLLANAAIQKQVNPKNPTNLTDPDKSDFMKFKFGDLTLDPTSGMRGVGMFIYGLGKIPFEEQKKLKGDTRMQALGKQGAGYGRGKLAPLYSTLADFYTGQDFNRNPLPYSDDKPTAGHHKLTWSEYAWQKAPLPVAEAANVTYQSAVEHGADKKVLNDYLWGILSGAISGSTGFRVGEFQDKPTPFNEEDKKDPTFKYFLDKGMELPNTSLSSEVITDEAAGTKKKVSDYPKDIQDKYQTEHKAQLKSELASIKDQKTVYVKSYTDASGKKINEVSINKPDGKSEEKSIDKLTTEELAQVLSIAQGNATRESKKKIFPQKSSNSHTLK